MEIFVLLPVILVMTAVAIALALHEQPLPVSAASAFVPALKPNKPGLHRNDETAGEAGPAKILKHADASAEPRQPSTSKATETVMDSEFSQTDVLLADALTEMIGLKAELYHLRSKLDSLNFEVARLAGGPHRTPPAASKRPVQLRKAA